MRQVYEKIGLSTPATIVTDKGADIFAAVPNVFPEAAHILCTWHFNRDVLTWVKKRFANEAKKANLYAKEVRKYARQRQQAFGELFKVIRWAQTETAFNTAYDALKARYQDEQYTDIFVYLNRTWFGKHKEKIIPAWTNKVLHFNNASSNRVEGIHYKIKWKIPKASKPHLATLLDEIRRFLTRLNRGLLELITKDRAVR